MRPNLKTRVKRAFTENVPIKILALILSVILWIVVVNVDDPDQTKTFTVSVTVTNEDVLTDAGRYFTVADGDNTVRVRVSASRSVIENLTSSDFTATADLNYLENDERIPVTVTYTGSSNGVSILSRQLYLYVEVGNDMMTKKEITVVTQGDVADGCIISETTTDPSSVTLTGPENVLSQVDSVVVYADVDGASADVVVETAVLHFLDGDGNEIDQSNITMDSDTASIYVGILQTKSIDVNVETSGELPDGLELESVTVDPTKLLIMGTADQINDITSVTIPGTVVNLSEMSASTETTVDLSTYLPDGVSVARGTSSQATISIVIVEEGSETYTVDTDQITVRNLGDGLRATMTSSTVEVTVSGSSDSLEALSAEDITGYVDASGLSAGTHTLQINFELDEDHYTVNTATVRITITSESSN